MVDVDEEISALALSLPDTSLGDDMAASRPALTAEISLPLVDAINIIPSTATTVKVANIIQVYIERSAASEPQTYDSTSGSCSGSDERL